MTHKDILAVEHYYNLSAEYRAQYADNFELIADQYDDPSAVFAEMKRIDAGLKALCLS